MSRGLGQIERSIIEAMSADESNALTVSELCVRVYGQPPMSHSVFSVSQPARFGGFCVALGFALARYSYGGPIDGRLLEVASAALGAVIALIGLWYWLMAKGAGVQTGEPK